MTEARRDRMPGPGAGAHPGWPRGALVGLWRALVDASRGRCPEPVDHATVLRGLLWLRLPLWVGALIASVVRTVVALDASAPLWLKPIHLYLDPQFSRVLSAWLLIMVPLGVPVLYAVVGLLAHVGLALTGPTTRSIGVSMATGGLGLAPGVVAVSLLDLAVLGGWVAGSPYLGCVIASFALTVGCMGELLARVHGVHRARAYVAAVWPAGVFLAVILVRGSLEIDPHPFLPGPTRPYYVP